MACPKIEHIIEKFTGFTDKPVKFLTVQSELKDDIKNLVKSLYDFTKKQEKDEKIAKKGALPELIVQDCDEEQVWQQIELQNNECWDQLVREVATCMSLKNNLSFPVKVAEEPAKVVLDDEGTLPHKDSTIPNQRKTKKKTPKNIDMKKKAGKETEVPEKKKNNAKFKSSIVDDQFFKLQEMEQFLLKEERSEGKSVPKDSDEESIDLFEEMDSEEDEEERDKEMMYADFFNQDGDENSDGFEQENGDDDIADEDEGMESEHDKNEDLEHEDLEEKKTKKKDKKVRFSEPSLSSDDNSDVNDIIADKKTTEMSEEKKSDFEKRQERLKKQIEKLEEKTLNEAPWQLKGEVDATKRPQNSLLEEVVDFDLTSRPAPIITEQTTLTLEDIIRQRVKDKAWDDVEKKEKAVDDQLNFRKTEILDHAKSKLSLAQVYETEYLKQKQALSGEVVEEIEPEGHSQIREAMRQLFAKLDALSNYHYTPKPPQAEVKIVTNTPAISMEEVAPIATSDATLLAPEEVKKKRKGELMNKEERTQTDKKRERRKKKKLQRAKGGKVMKVTEHRNTKKGVEGNDKSVKTSKAFFQQLNDDTASLIKSKNKNVKFGKNKVK